MNKDFSIKRLERVRDLFVNTRMTSHYAKIVDKYIGEEMDKLCDMYDIDNLDYTSELWDIKSIGMNELVKYYEYC